MTPFAARMIRNGCTDTDLLFQNANRVINRSIHGAILMNVAFDKYANSKAMISCAPYQRTHVLTGHPITALYDFLKGIRNEPLPSCSA